MELIYIILILVIAFYLYEQYSTDSKKSKKSVTFREPEVIGEVQADQKLSLPDKLIKMGKELPYPKISWDSQVSDSNPGIFTNVLPSLPTIDIVRDTPESMNKKRQYLPDYYRKDQLSGNTIGTTELNSFTPDLDEPDNSWSDDNVSDLPGYHTSDVTNTLTNPGAFYDKNNQFHDSTSPKTTALVSDTCFQDKQGNQFCMDNTRIQNIPPSLIEDPKHCHVLNNIGVHKDKINTNEYIVSNNVETIHGQSYLSWNYDNDKIMNGSHFMGNIKGSKSTNESYSPLLDRYAQSECISN